MTIQLKPEQERLIDQAIQAGLIRTADDVIDIGMESLQKRLEAQHGSARQPNTEQWLEELNSWVNSHPKTTPLLGDEAISRESIYGTRGR